MRGLRSVVVLWACTAGPVWAEQTSGGQLFPAITLTTDHRFNGMSLSNGEPVLQGSLHLWRADGYYAGVFMSGVDFLDTNGTSLETDVYVGRNLDVQETQWKLEAMYSIYNDDEPGPTYDFLQVKLQAERALDQFTPRISLAYSPRGSYGAGSTLQVRGELDYRVADWLTFEVMIGRGLAEMSSERNYAEVGFSARWQTIHFDLHYHGIETDLPLCDFVDWCDDAVVAKVTLATY